MKKTSKASPFFLLFFCLSTLFYHAVVIGANRSIPNTAATLKNNLNAGGFSIRPFAFTENKGQIIGTDGLSRRDVKYSFQKGMLQIFLLESGIAYQFKKTHYPREYKSLVTNKFLGNDEIKLATLQKKIRVETCRMDMTLVGANKNARITNEDLNTTDHFYNLDVLDVHSYNKVTYHDIYPGIDWVIYTKDNEVKYDFVVKPGADPSIIKMAFKNQEKLSLEKDGSLILKNKLGSICEKAPKSFQGDGRITNRFILRNNTVSFALGKYDAGKTLVIDPTLTWATYYGGTDFDQGLACRTDASGNVYLSGIAASLSSIASGGYQNTCGGGTDAFLVKFNGSGVRLWATYYGGAGLDVGRSCDTDPSGNVYLAGFTSSTLGIASGGHQNTLGGANDLFLVKFDGSGIRLWATYYGGPTPEFGAGSCATDGFGNVYLAGWTNSTSGIASGGHQNIYGGLRDAFLVKFDGSGARLWATYYGGASQEFSGMCCTDGLGNVYLSGSTLSTADIASGGHQNSYSGGNGDVFLVKFDSAGVRQWATYYAANILNGRGACSADLFGNVYLYGITTNTTGIAFSGHQNSLGGGQDGFLVKFNGGGVRQWGTYYGGSNPDDCTSVSSDAFGNVYMAGFTNSAAGIASTGTGVQGIYKGTGDAFLAKFNSSGQRQWGIYYGGITSDNAESCSTDLFGNIYMVGTTASTAGIASGGHQNTYGGLSDAFLVKYCDLAPSVSSLSGNTITCAGTSQNYSVTNDPLATYIWSLPGGWTGSSTTNTISLTANASGMLVLTAYNSCSSSTQTLNLLVNACVGFENYASDQKRLLIYPNPGNGEFVIESSASEQILLTNVLGQIILEKSIYPGYNYLSLNNYEKGVYFITCKKSESGSIKIIKQ